MTEMSVERIALVSHDYNKRYRSGLWDYSESYNEILTLCDREACDTVVFALYTWDTKSSVAKTHATIFRNTVHVRQVLIEVGDLPFEGFPNIEDLAVEVWRREATKKVLRQKFSREGDQAGKGRFIHDLPERLFGSTAVVICGESGIVQKKRAGGFRDDFGFVDWLAAKGVSLILNPIHDFMGISHGIDMRDKRRHYSCGGRTVVSVWNQGNGKDANVPVPWTVFRDGKDATHTVRELPFLFSARSDMRIGILEIGS